MLPRKLSRLSRLINATDKCASTANTLLYLHNCRKHKTHYYFVRLNSEVYSSYRIYRYCYSWPLHLCNRFIHNSSLSCSSSSLSSSSLLESSAVTSCTTTAKTSGTSKRSKENYEDDDDDKHELPEDWKQTRESSTQSMMLDKEIQIPNLRSKEEQEIARWCEHAEKVLEKEESDYDGYVTMTIQKCKDVILTQNSSEQEIANALSLLDKECKEVERLVGHRVQRPMPERTLLRQKLELERAKLREISNPFKRVVQSKSNYTVNINAEGDEELNIRQSKSSLVEKNDYYELSNSLQSSEDCMTDMSNVNRSNLHNYTKECKEANTKAHTQFTSTIHDKSRYSRDDCNKYSIDNSSNNDGDGDGDGDGAINSNNKDVKKDSNRQNMNNDKHEQCTENRSVELDNDTVEVTMDDLNHIRFLRSIALRRLGQFELAEKISYDILRSDCYHVDVIKSLLEMYLGFENYNRVNLLLLFLQHEFEKEYSVNTECTTLLANKSKNVERCAKDSLNDWKEHEDASKDNTIADITRNCTPSTIKEINEYHTTNENDTSNVAENSTSAEIAEVEIVENLFRPLDIALQLLAAQIVNAISRQVCIHGEGRASRSIVHILTELARNMNRSLMSCLIEAIFRTNEEHQFRLKYEEVEIPSGVAMTTEEYYKKSKQILQTTIISILKGLLLPQMLYFVNEPVRFRCMLLSNLHIALREADRTQESFRAAEEYMSYYKEQKLLSSKKSTPQPRREIYMETYAQKELKETCDVTNEMHYAKEYNKSEQKYQNNQLQEQKCQQESKELQAGEKSYSASSSFSIKNTEVEEEELLESTSELSSAKNVNTRKETYSQFEDIVADQEEVYKQTLFTYLHDYILSEPSQGRKKCLAAIDEFPNAAEPWILLSLVLHKEDARANLDDAIVAVRHAMNLEPTNLRAIMVLANFYKAGKRYALYREMMKRCAALESLLLRGSSEHEIVNIITELQALPDVITPAREAEEIKEVDRELNETYAQMERAMAYSVPIDKDKRTFAPTQLPSPMRQQEINMDRPSYMNEPIPTE